MAGPFGNEAIESLCEALLPLNGALPWAPPEVHTSNGFRTMSSTAQ